MVSGPGRVPTASAKAPIPGGGFLIEERLPEEVFTPEDFTEQHRLIAGTAEQFMRNEVLPRWEQIERQEPGLTPRLLRQAGELGLLSIDIPERYGGTEMDKVSSTIVVERFAQYASFLASHGAHSVIGTLPIVFFGNEEQKKKYLPRLATGELIAAYCLSEAEAGSDALSIRTRAVLSPDGKHYLLNGEKMWITNAGFADLFIVFAKVDGEKFSCFIVEKGFPGVATGAEEKKLGIKGSSTRAVILEDARVPAKNLLGEVGRGHVVAFNILNVGRFRLAAGCIGGAKQALQHAAGYANQRRAFGKTIAQFGLIQEKLAEMATRIYAGECMIYRTAGLIDPLLAEAIPDSPAYGDEVRKAIEEYAVECSIDKVYCSEILDYVADECVQIYGGYGYHQDYPAERAYRDARINRIFEGTSEINRLLITGMLLKRAASGRLGLRAAIEGLFQGSPASGRSTEARSMEAKSMEERSTEERNTETASLLGTEKHLVAAVKKTALLVTGVAYQKFADSLADQQEITAAISDIVMEVFAMESALLRAGKMAARSGVQSSPQPIPDSGPQTVDDKTAHVLAMTRLFLHSRMDWVEQRARTVLAGAITGDALRRQLAILQQVTRRDAVDTIALRRQIAARVIQKGKYAAG